MATTNETWCRKTLVIALLLGAAVLAGCVSEQDGLDADGEGDPDRDENHQESVNELVTLSFVEENRTTREENYTVTIDPQDPLLGPGIVMHQATGEYVFLKFIDITELLPPGMHAHVEATAKWDPSAPQGLACCTNLQWFTFDTWTSGTVSQAEPGQASLASYVTNYGPEPANMILVVIDQEARTEPVEVNVHVRVDPLDDALHNTHVVAAELEGGAVPITVRLENDPEATLHVRGPDDELVFLQEVANDDTVHLPPESAQGEYLFTLWDTSAPGRLVVPAENLSSEQMRTVDISPNLGEPRDLTPHDETTWTVDFGTTPYWTGVMFQGIDGRSTFLEAQVTVTAPDGTVVVDASIDQMCTYGFSTLGSQLAHESFEPGTYTFTVTTGNVQGCQVNDIHSAYLR